MTRSSTRYLPTARFLFLAGMAMAVTLLFANVASAEPPAAGTEGEQAQGGNLVLFMIKSLGWLFGPCCSPSPSGCSRWSCSWRSTCG